MTERPWFWLLSLLYMSRAVTERPWFWSFGRSKTSILRFFCHSYSGWGGGGAGSENPDFGALGDLKPQFSGLFVIGPYGFILGLGIGG